MKPPKPGSAMKMPMPSSRELNVGRKILSAFAHHAPAPEKEPPRMERPKHGTGPHN